jgi:hypothetical protein
MQTIIKAFALGSKEVLKTCYTNSYPSLSLKIFSDSNMRSKSLHHVLHTKSWLWEYEDEWRVIVPDGDITYPVPGNITSVVLGARISDLDK